MLSGLIGNMFVPVEVNEEMQAAGGMGCGNQPKFNVLCGGDCSGANILL